MELVRIVMNPYALFILMIMGSMARILEHSSQPIMLLIIIMVKGLAIIMGLVIVVVIISFIIYSRLIIDSNYFNYFHYFNYFNHLISVSLTN